MIEVINRSSIELTKLEFSYKEEVKDKDANVYAEDIGKLPLVVINGVNIESKDIKYFKLYNDKYMPELEMIFNDPTNKIFDSKYPLDQQIVSILIKANSDLLMPIRMDFWITKFNSIKNKSGDSDWKTYQLFAKLNIPFIIKNASFRGTSYDVLLNVSKEAKLGFASNIKDNTNDSMPWINCGIDYVREFIPEIVKRSYIDDNTFLWSYIDFWYNLNYIDIEKQLNISTDNDKNIQGTEKLIGEKQIIPLILSNHPNYNSTNQYIDKFNLANDTTQVNFNIGYLPHVYYYMTKEKNIVDVLMDPISTKGDKNDKIVLKGQPDDNNFAKDQSKNYFMGKNDTDNSHKNFMYAEQLNFLNIEYLQKIRLNIILKNLNFQLYRFQPVKVELYKLRELDPDPGFVTPSDVVNAKDTDKYKLNERLSGDWLILGINFIYSKKEDENGGRFAQEITLVKRELSAAKIAKK